MKTLMLMCIFTVIFLIISIVTGYLAFHHPVMTNDNINIFAVLSSIGIIISLLGFSGCVDVSSKLDGL